ncbi:MAG: RNA polymerase-associated protein RapA [Gammaproteobacteria bacterium]|nr:MAG: RNA polymerase-associated protein RapA [Gammaproteobacteria bacterium]
MADIEFQVGQRWVSNSEAELGLGIIKDIAGRRIELSFPAAGESRTYAANIAPLSRVQYPVGERVKTNEDVSFIITARHEMNGCYIYQGDDDAGNEVSIHEMDLNSFVQFSQPQDRLFAGQVDKNSQFELRTEALAHQHRLQSSSVFGLMGARAQLLPHQIYIAHQVAQRHAPRVLLADEVGLGKTIEAGLIIHQQLITGRAERVLIVVPDSLVHQWLVEMLRRFNLAFTIMDEDRHDALIEAGEVNPFESGQLMLCSLSMLTTNPTLYEDALSCKWDLMIVDEAHHLRWDEEKPSAEYQCIDGLATEVAGLLLLTATPEQLGLESHFARLRLLDPDRYFDLEKFRIQEASYQPISELVQQLLNNSQESIASLQANIEQYLGEQSYKVLAETTEFEAERDRAINALLDQHGTGRILFRNTRDAVTGFPERQLNTYPLTAPESYLTNAATQDILGLLQAENCLGDDWLHADSRVSWLAEWLLEHKADKVLIICAQAETAQLLEQALRTTLGIRSSVFHEGLSLINRDRAAAYFADEEEGAQVLICSEIGSEGRNFQFSHHLVLFDLPLNPDLLEQRIGRLDRIGQTHTVEIHVPYFEHTAQAVLLNWYHQGLNAFERVFPAGGAIYKSVKDELHQCLRNADNDAEITALISNTAILTAETLEVLQQGRNRLLELNSCNLPVANELIADLEEAGQTNQLASFMDKVFDEYGVEQQMHSADSIIVEPGNHMLHHQFPELPEDGLTATYQRHRALVREDMTFLSWEHPMVLASLDMTINSDFGNSCFCTLETDEFAAGTLLLEAIFTIKCPAPKSLQLGRYLNHCYLRVVINEQGQTFNDLLDEDNFNQQAGRIPRSTAQELIRHARENITTLIDQAKKHASAEQQSIVNNAVKTMRQSLQTEQDRLTALAKVNNSIRQEEINYLEQSQALLAEYLNDAQLSLDAVRVAIVTA